MRRDLLDGLQRRAAQFTSELTEHLYWWLAASRYHFPRYHESLRIRLEKPIARNGK
jgi:hypothetical protein